MQHSRAHELNSERGDAGVGKRSHAIPLPLATANAELAGREVDVLHPERQRFEQPEPGSVEQARDEPGLPVEPREQLPHLAGRQHDGQAARPLCAHQPRELAHRLPQHVPVQEHERVQRLVLGRRRDLRRVRQMAQERRDLRLSERRGMPLPMEQDEAPHPVDVRILSARAVVADAKLRPHPIEEARRLRRP